QRVGSALALATGPPHMVGEDADQPGHEGTRSIPSVLLPDRVEERRLNQTLGETATGQLRGDEQQLRRQRVEHGGKLLCITVRAVTLEVLLGRAGGHRPSPRNSGRRFQETWTAPTRRFATQGTRV